MKSIFTVTDLIVIVHPIIFGLLSVGVLCGILVAVIKGSRSVRIIAVLIGAMYALFIGWRVKTETWVGASMIHFAIMDQESCKAIQTSNETNKAQEGVTEEFAEPLE